MSLKIVSSSWPGNVIAMFLTLFRVSRWMPLVPEREHPLPQLYSELNRGACSGNRPRC